MFQKLKEEASILKNYYKPLIAQSDKRKLQLETIKITEKTNLQVTIVNPNGEVIATTESSSHRKNFEPEFAQAIKRGEGKAIRRDPSQKTTIIHYTLPIEEDNKVLALLRISMPIDRLRISTVRIIGWVIYIFSLLFGGVVIFYKLTSPINTIVNALQQIKSGQFPGRSFIKRKDEIGVLNNLVNEINETMQTLINSFNADKEELKSLISTLNVGLVVIDDKGKIVMNNENFKRVVRIDDVVGRYYWEVLPDPQFENFMQELNENRAITQELVYGERVYLVAGNLIKNFPAKKNIVIFNDITDIKKLSEMKSEFVVNASHELKTPLTSIKGSVEALKESATKSQMPFIKIMERNIERVIKIIDDLLLLASLEERRDEKLEFEQINLTSLLRYLKKLFAGKLQEKNVKLKINIAPEAKSIYGDAFLIEEMLINLLDNAIKYNIKGGKITIETIRQNDTIVITVEDTGIGIPQDKLPKIFERFYVVDKARSRVTGGTGLGLAIVKHIVLKHEGEINVTSEIGKGTKFVIKLPQNR
ncbi:MAG: ATP-binding protein [candidate division WOR-3 bacterium]|nr:ATP-binding protein [candidate division WOR-3 bacterium]MDW7987979.1 ATP-binding protein [candidate division WOR-3 bacterium]